jgi:hypothetical protein
MMGMDLMTSIGIVVDREQRYIRWGRTEINEILHMLYNAANEPDIFCKKQKRDRTTF